MSLTWQDFIYSLKILSKLKAMEETNKLLMPAITLVLDDRGYAGLPGRQSNSRKCFMEVLMMPG